jgi:predicted N-formylglutamate amidohydrolase
VSETPLREDGGLLAPDEPPPFDLIDGAANPPIVIVCDHASNRIPRALESLGVAEERLQDHIAWDIGAGAVARLLAARFDASAVIAGYSRLVVDLNRAPEDATAFPRISDGILIPGNVSLAPEAKRERLQSLFEPYHRAIDSLLDALATAGRHPAYLSIHSFTPRFHRTRRPWQISVLWDKDPRIAVPLLAALRAPGDLVVGDNEPYSGKHPADYTIDSHAETRGLPHVSIEIRQDLIADERGQKACADRLVAALEGILGQSALYTPL